MTKQNKITRKNSMWKRFMKQIVVENNTDYTFRIRYTIFNSLYAANGIKTTSILFGIYQTTEPINYSPITIDGNLFYPHHNKILIGDNKAYYVIFEIINQKNVVIRKALLHIGDIWSINTVTDEELNREIPQEVPLDIVKNTKWFWSFT